MKKGVEKISLIKRALNINTLNYSKNYKCTIEEDFFIYMIKINNTIIKLRIWDTSGLEKYKSIIPSLYRDNSLGIFVYAIEE